MVQIYMKKPKTALPYNTNVLLAILECMKFSCRIKSGLKYIILKLTSGSVIAFMAASLLSSGKSTIPTQIIVRINIDLKSQGLVK